MHPRIANLPKPAPDYRRFMKALRREKPDRTPLVELAIHPESAAALLGETVPDKGAARAVVALNVRAHHLLGYDVVKTSAVIPWDVQRLAGRDQSALSVGDDSRQWANEHAGPIGDRASFEQFAWPTPSDIDFGPVETAVAKLPEGMGLLGFSGGVLEFAMDLIGMERFMLASLTDPALVTAMIERVGQTIQHVFEAYCEIDAVCALWLGDDLGHKHGLLVSPKLLEQHVFPWYRRFVELAHRHGRPFILHTCGHTDKIMPTLIDDVGIDAKHSFEDGIQTVEQYADRWGDKVAVLGGVDVHLLASGDETAVRARVRAILEHAAPRGGYACGSGNSITNYIPPENFLTMIETVAEFNRVG